MTTVEMEMPSAELTRSKRLKLGTQSEHGSLDSAITQQEPFSDRARYVVFLGIQYMFHRDIDALYHHVKLSTLLPDLVGRRRLGLIEQDFGDLCAEMPTALSEPAFADNDALDIPSALGWLYVAEGSNLGAAFLLKEAARLNLSESFGARHLAAAPQGRGLHWRTFTAALNALALSPAEDKRVVAGAETAFNRVRGLVRDGFGV